MYRVGVRLRDCPRAGGKHRRLVFVVLRRPSKVMYEKVPRLLDKAIGEIDDYPKAGRVRCNAALIRDYHPLLLVFCRKRGLLVV